MLSKMHGSVKLTHNETHRYYVYIRGAKNPSGNNWAKSVGEINRTRIREVIRPLRFCIQQSWFSKSIFFGGFSKVIGSARIDGIFDR